eukprot:TRINITY_DN5820_c0_g1_i2.p1 TRINITY_DN5820_c0_g1~~TRINITY_DN5820_c0_g1_i2.p1  ORF type:complete len:387 (+),score=61.43 TRINITY_DN5820_c0_g1_i2:58-1218(+)
MPTLRGCARKCGRCLFKAFSNVEYACLSMSAFGLVLVMIGIFVPRWRVDDYGVRPLSKYLSGWPTNFVTKEYGLLSVRGSRSQSWSLITRNTCDWNTASQVSTIAVSAFTEISAMTSSSSSSSGCTSYEKCGGGFANHMSDRCEKYSAMYYVSMATLGTSFLGILVSLCGLLVATLGKMKQSAGIAYGLMLFAGIVMLASNAAWALVTHFSFVELGTTAWYPYPDLGIGWFLHLYGCVTILVSMSVFGWLMMPVVMAYDAQEAKLAKRKEKLSKISKRIKMNKKADAEQQQGLAEMPQFPHLFGDGPEGLPQPGLLQASQQRYTLQGFPQPGFQQHRREDDFGLGRASVPNLPPAHLQPQPDYRTQADMNAAGLYGKPVPASVLLS